MYDSNTLKSTASVEEITFWGAGKKLGSYSLTQIQPGGPDTQPQLVAAPTGTNYYFGGKLVKNSTGYVTPDRLGSIGKYFPYGQERPSATTDGKEKFATYFRDSETGLDYANARYHQPGMGRFMTPDPYGGSRRDPGSLNRYAYVGGDPINRSDSGGNQWVCAGPSDDQSCGLEPDPDTGAVPLPGADPTNPNLGCGFVTGPDDPAWQQCFGGGVSVDQKSDGNQPATVARAKGSLPTLRSSLTSVIGSGTNCNSDITGQFGTGPGHGSIEDMFNHISQVDFWDLTVPGTGDMLVTQAVSGADKSVYRNQTLADALGTDVAAVLYGSYGPGGYTIAPTIIIGSDFYFAGAANTTLEFRQRALVHEMLHIYTGKNDADLATALGLTLNGLDPSLAITRYLRSDCTVKEF
jgi:RHS repeat-associated protein